MAHPVGETELVANAQRGDQQAFTTLLRSHDDTMRGLAYNLMGSQAAMDDLLQDAYLKAFRNISRFRGDAKFSTWLYQIVYRTGLDHLAKSGRRSEVSLDHLLDRPTLVPDVDALVIDHQQLRSALASLPPDQLAALWLVDHDGYGYDEVAEMLGIASGTVASRLNRARHAVRVALGAPEQPTTERGESNR